jgi:hypothetical protein
MDPKGVVSKINMPMFVGLAENETFCEGQPEKVAAGTGSNASLVRFDNALSAGKKEWTFPRRMLHDEQYYNYKCFSFRCPELSYSQQTVSSSTA